MASDRIGTRLFLSWAHANERAKTDLVGLLEPRLAIQRGLQFYWWEDSHLRVGETWRRGILARLEECDYSLQLLSPEFFASTFITEVEVPPFVGEEPAKKVLPVGLVRFPMDGQAELLGIDEHQIFLLRGKYFSELDRRGKEEFALRLAGEIARRVRGDDPWKPL
jgi:hypothetical protein